MSKINVNNIEANDASTDITVTTGGSQSLLVDTNGKLTVAGNLSVNGNNYPSAGPLSNRNLIINGAMQVAQRGTSVTGATSGGYSTVDRWAHNASGGTLSLSQQALTVGQTDIPSQFKYFFRVNATTGDNNAGIWQKIEGVDRVQGTVTLSFYAKGTNPSSGNFEIELDQSFGSSGSAGPSYATNYETFTVTSSWQRFTKTISVPDITGSTIGGGNDYYRIYFRQPNSDTGTSAWTLDITGVQLEVGDTATPFEHRSYGDELAKCYRYYFRHMRGNVAGSTGSDAYLNVASRASSSNTMQVPYQWPVPMRTKPSLSRSGNVIVANNNTASTGGGLVADSFGLIGGNLQSTGHSSLSANQCVRAYLSGSGAWVDFDAEL